MRRKPYEKQTTSQLTSDSTFMGGFKDLIAKAKEQRKGNGNKRKWTDTIECSNSQNDNLNASNTETIHSACNLPQIASIQKEQQALNRKMKSIQKEQQIACCTNSSTAVSSPPQQTMSVSLPAPTPSINNVTITSSNKEFTKKQKIESTTVVRQGKPTIKPNTPSPLQKGETWNCHKCTYENKVMYHQRKSRPRCAMCQSLRDESQEKVSPSSAYMVEIDC